MSDRRLSLVSRLRVPSCARCSPVTALPLPGLAAISGLLLFSRAPRGRPRAAGGKAGGRGGRLRPVASGVLLPLTADFKDNLSKVYEAIEEADFLAIDGEFSGTAARSVSRIRVVT